MSLGGPGLAEFEIDCDGDDAPEKGKEQNKRERQRSGQSSTSGGS